MNKRILSVLVAWLMLSFSAYSMHASNGPELRLTEGEKIDFSFRGSVSLLTGESRELVFVNLPSGRRHKLSELIWEIEDVYVAGGVICINILQSTVQINLGYWGSIDGGSGNMYDYDWMQYENSGAWTDRSRSEIDADAAMFDLSTAIHMLEFETDGFFGDVSLHAVLGYKQETWDWTDRAYEYTYSSPAGFRDATGSFGGENAITLKHVYSILYFGAEINGSIGPVEMSVVLLYGPDVKAEQDDYHILRDLYFTAELSGGDYFSVGVEGLYNINSSLFCSLALEYQEIPEFSGTERVSGYEAGLADAAAVSHELSIITGSFGIRF